MNLPSEDTYAYEIEQELLAEYRGMHLPMKKWFMDQKGSEIAKYGEFPSFWQDLGKWHCYKEIKRAYLMHLEGIEVSLKKISLENYESKGEDVSISMKTNELKNKIQNKIENEKSENDGTRKPKRNRWGDAKKSRWGEKIEMHENLKSQTETHKNNMPVAVPAKKISRRSKWSAEGAVQVSSTVEAAPPLTQEQIQETLILQMRLKQVNEKLMTVLHDAILKENDPNKSPSPPPKYGPDGKRTNTREVRMREALNNERNDIIEAIMKLNPHFQAPIDYIRRKPFRRLYIPQTEYPGYNFIGLIIGPRGNTQKRMERETGCKIAIRGRGSVKEGARRTLIKTVDEEDDLHVFVQGDTEEQVEKAAKEISSLLRPVDDELNEHKQRQLRELALINGTLRDDDFCHICAEKGHRQYECPKRAQQIKMGVEVRCALCGDASHPTRDCKHASGTNSDPTKAAALDNEYLSFMAELGDKSAQTQQETLKKLIATNPGLQKGSYPFQTHIPDSILSAVSSEAKVPHLVYQPPNSSNRVPIFNYPPIGGMFPLPGMPAFPMQYPMMHMNFDPSVGNPVTMQGTIPPPFPFHLNQVEIDLPPPLPKEDQINMPPPPPNPPK